MRSREAAAGEDSFVSAGAFVAPTLIQSACVEWCSGLAAHLRRGPFFREKKRLCTVPSGVARQGIQVRCSGGGRDCEGKLGNHDVQKNVTSKVNPPRWNFRCFGNTLFPRDFYKQTQIWRGEEGETRNRCRSQRTHEQQPAAVRSKPERSCCAQERKS